MFYKQIIYCRNCGKQVNTIGKGSTGYDGEVCSKQCWDEFMYKRACGTVERIKMYHQNALKEE